MKDSQVSFNGDGDGHEDAAGEEDVVEGVEEVGEEVVMDLGGQTTEGGRVGGRIFKCPADTLGDANNQKEKIKYCKSNEQVVEVALEALFTKDRDGENVGAHPESGQRYGAIAPHQQVYVPQELIFSLSPPGAIRLPLHIISSLTHISHSITSITKNSLTTHN